jgi:hypothetical protein
MEANEVMLLAVLNVWVALREGWLVNMQYTTAFRGEYAFPRMVVGAVFLHSIHHVED